jgi:diadenosine tetraphosphate (Ap4A) HIT family hydrolase
MTLDELIADSRFPFAGTISVKPLDAPVVPEPDLAGVDPATCFSCGRPDTDYVWTDDRWRLVAPQPSQLRGMVVLETRGHYDSFADLPPELLSDFGPVTARVERALLGLGGIARVHVNRWGDGGAHFHVWFMPRPLGMLQLRGSMLPMWLDLLPDLPEEEAGSVLRELGAALALEGGTAPV